MNIIVIDKLVVERAILFATFQKDIAECIEEWMLYKSACEVLHGDCIIGVCLHSPVTKKEVESCVASLKERAKKEIKSERIM